jgi:hypothetical protein
VARDATACGVAAGRQVDDRTEMRHGPSDSLTAVPVCHVDPPLAGTPAYGLIVNHDETLIKSHSSNL